VNKNLKPQNTRTKEEQREIARLGGKASGKVRREKSTIAKMLKQWADSPITCEGLKKEAESYGLETNEGRSLITLSLIKGTLDGNPKYMERLMNLMGEDVPTGDEIGDDGFMQAIKGSAGDDWINTSEE
jgi:hypothetical protein